MLVGEQGPGKAREEQLDADAADLLWQAVVVQPYQFGRTRRQQHMRHELGRLGRTDTKPPGHKGEATRIEQGMQVLPEQEKVFFIVDG